MSVSKYATDPYVSNNLHDEDPVIGLWWAFGPQGHPASLRVSLDTFNDGNTYIHVCTQRTSYYDKVMPGDITRLSRIIAYGKCIDDKFGRDPFWWKCAKCGTECSKVRVAAEEEATAWFLANPIPL